MKDLYYRFTDKQEMLSTLLAINMAYTDDNGTTVAILGNHQYASWIVGTIEGVIGYHYNLRLINEDFDVSLLEPFIVVPQNPKYIWA